MALLTPREWRVAEAIAGIGYCNPFLPERVERERRVLGNAFVEVGPIIWARSGLPIEKLLPNFGALRERAAGLVEELRIRLEQGRPASPEELLLYEDLALYRLFSKNMSSFDRAVERYQLRESDGEPVAFWGDFRSDFAHFLQIEGRPLPSNHDPAVIFAGFYQIQRAFTHIFQKIIGGSMPAARLRAAAWESIFTHNMRRYTHVTRNRMAHVTTLITGPSGTGKELVAQAIGRSRYLAFDVVKKRFAKSSYTPLNLSAFVPTLLESELFGHIKGAFVGALDRKGWLEQCSGTEDTVFLDEIGELDEAIQVKLLRVLQERCFVRVGETTDRPREFHGKIITATNRDLASEMRAGRFREDFYHRLCDDNIVTPSLAEQLADRPQDLTEMVRFLASQILGELTPSLDGPADAERCAREADALTGEAADWIESNLKDYSWPGNFRELSQCVRNVMIHGKYCPASTPRSSAGRVGAVEEFLCQVREVEVTADKLLDRYCAMAYHQSGENSAEAGRRLDLDQRVVKRRLDQAFLQRLRDLRVTEAG